MISTTPESFPSSSFDIMQKSFFIKFLKVALIDSEEIWNRNTFTHLLLKNGVLVGLLQGLRNELNNKHNFEALLEIVSLFMNSQTYREICKREIQLILEYITVVWRFLSVKTLQHQSILGFFDNILSSFDNMIYLFRPQNSELFPNVLQR
jgi:hypothetical protein